MVLIALRVSGVAVLGVCGFLVVWFLVGVFAGVLCWLVIGVLVGVHWVFNLLFVGCCFYSWLMLPIGVHACLFGRLWLFVGCLLWFVVYCCLIINSVAIVSVT